MSRARLRPHRRDQGRARLRRHRGRLGHPLTRAWAPSCRGWVWRRGSVESPRCPPPQTHPGVADQPRRLELARHRAAAGSCSRRVGAGDACRRRMPGWPSPDRWPPATAREPARATARRRIIARRIALAGVTGVLAAGAATAALGGPTALQRLLDEHRGAAAPVATALAGDTAPPPTLAPVSSAASGSAIDHTNYASAALGKGGSFYVYLPPGYATTAQRYPVVYLLPGYKQTASDLLGAGVQPTLDRLIAGAQGPAADRRGDPGRARRRGVGEARDARLRVLRRRGAGARGPHAADGRPARRRARSPATRSAATAR